MNPNAMAMHPEDAREVLPDEMIEARRSREKLTAAIVHDLVELNDERLRVAAKFIREMVVHDRAFGTARPLTSASLAAEQQEREAP